MGLWIPANRWACFLRSAAVVFFLAVGAFGDVSAQDSVTASCDQVATPESSPVGGAMATPQHSDADIDLAYLTLQAKLATTSIELATLARSDLELAELNQYAEETVALAETDVTTLDALASELYPQASPDLEALVSIVEQAKMKLDLPSGQGGLSSFGDVVGIGLMCTTDGPYVDIYLASAIDLSQQQIDLAQVAVVTSSNADIVAFATGVIDRETVNIGTLITWQSDRLDESATPAT